MLLSARRNRGWRISGDPDEHGKHGDDAELAEPEHELDEPPRADSPAVRRLTGAVRPRHALSRSLRLGHAACASSWPVAAAMIVSSVASACANSAVSRPSRMTRMRSAIAQHLGQLGGDHQDRRRPRRRARDSSAVHLGLRADVDAARGLVDDQQRRAGGRATWPARPSAGCRRRACDTGSVSRPYFSCSRCAQSAANAALGGRRDEAAPCAAGAARPARCSAAIDMSMTRPCWRRSSGT